MGWMSALNTVKDNHSPAEVSRNSYDGGRDDNQRDKSVLMKKKLHITNT